MEKSASGGVYATFATFVEEGGAIAGYVLTGDQISRENELTQALELRAAG
jgi:rubredoxin-NAD+ reductase